MPTPRRLFGVVSLWLGLAGPLSAWNVPVDQFGARGDGVADDTAAIQAALNASVPGGSVSFTPGKRYRIAGTLTGLVPKSDTRVILRGATLLGEDQPGGRCRIFTISGKSRIKLSGGTFLGRRTGMASWSIAVHVSDSTDIVVEDAVFRDFDTDALAVTGDLGCRRVTIRRCRVSNAGRSGMSLISGSDITVEDSLFEGSQNADTNMPRAGLEAEPNTDNSLSRVTVARCHFRNNQGSGLFFQVGHGRSVTDVTLVDNVAQNNGVGGIILNGLANVVVSRNRISGHLNRNGYGIGLTRRAANVVVKGNVLEGNYRGIYCEGSDGVSIESNIVVGSGAGAHAHAGDDADGIHVRGYTLAADPPLIVVAKLASITGNLVRDAAGRGILLARVSQAQLADNVVLDSGQHGIQVQFTTTDAQIQGNIVARSGLEADRAYQDVFLSHGSARLQVNQNQLRQGVRVMSGVAQDNVTTTVVAQNCLLAGPPVPLLASDNATGTAYEWRGWGDGWNRTGSADGVAFVP
jgi:parallel beta-helix repeat protein